MYPYNRTDYPESDLLSSFSSEGRVNTVTLLCDRPVVSSESLQRQALSTSRVFVKRRAGSVRPRRMSATRLAKALLRKTARGHAVERLVSVVKADRAESLSAGSRHLSQLKQFY